MNLRKLLETGRKKIESFGVKEWGMLLLAGVCCLVIVLPGEQKQAEVQEQKETAVISTSAGEDEDYIRELENRLCSLLSDVENVGNVKVMITAKETVQKNVLH